MKLLFFIFLFSCVFSLRAQTIGGRLTDAQQQPVPQANIVLQTTDSVFVCGSMSDDKGEFRLPKVRPGNYRLQVSCIGYYTLYLDLPDVEKNVNIGTLRLDEDTRLLCEVTVTASSLISNVDKHTVIPGKKHVAASANGVDLLRLLMLPRLCVNPMDGSISTTEGGSVQLCINDRKVTKEEVLALLPNEVIRVETQENPGVRYGDVAMVVNYVVHRYDTGGSVGYSGQQSVKSGFGDHHLTSKLNFGKSEVSFYYNTRQQYFRELWYDKSEIFRFVDMREYHRTQHAEALGGKKDFYEQAALSYNLQDDNRYLLNVKASLDHDLSPVNHYIGQLITQEYPTSVTGRDERKHLRSLMPSLDIYFQRNLRNKQFIALDLLGTYIGTNNRSLYAEYLGQETVVNYFSGINGKKQSLIGEIVYEKDFGRTGRVTAGLKHTQAWTDNSYRGTLDYRTRMMQAETYAYLQQDGRLGTRMTYRLGLGATRSYFHQKGSECYDHWSFNPQLMLTYRFNDYWNAAFESVARNINPSLSQLSEASQLTDSLQLNRGNPLLKPYTYYGSSLHLRFSRGKWYVGAYSRYDFYDNPVMEQTYREADRFVHSYANHSAYHLWQAGVNARVGLLWNVLQLGGSLAYVSQRSQGTDYRHTSRTVNWGVEAALMWHSLTATFAYRYNSDQLWGEHLYTGEEVHYVDLRYRLKHLNIGLRLLNPFQKDYARHERSLNRYTSYDYHYHLDDVARMLCLTLSWNLNFGRKYQSGGRRVTNSDKDTGIIQ